MPRSAAPGPWFAARSKATSPTRFQPRNAIWKAKSRRPTLSRRWRDALPGAVFATILFEGGKYLIALHIGETYIASSFGGGGAIIVLLLWIFYSAQIFLLGAEFSRVWTLGVAKDCGTDRGNMPPTRRFAGG